MQYDPDHPAVDTDSIADLIATIDKMHQHSNLQAFLKTIPLPNVPTAPNILHLLLTATVCHHFLNDLPVNYQDSILNYMNELGYSHYTLQFQLRRRLSQSFPFHF